MIFGEGWTGPNQFRQNPNFKIISYQAAIPSYIIILFQNSLGESSYFGYLNNKHTKHVCLCNKGITLFVEVIGQTHSSHKS